MIRGYNCGLKTARTIREANVGRLNRSESEEARTWLYSKRFEEPSAVA
jgi:hypothetical protein